MTCQNHGISICSASITLHLWCGYSIKWYSMSSELMKSLLHTAYTRISILKNTIRLLKCIGMSKQIQIWESGRIFLPIDSAARALPSISISSHVILIEHEISRVRVVCIEPISARLVTEQQIHTRISHPEMPKRHYNFICRRIIPNLQWIVMNGTTWRRDCYK